MTERKPTRQKLGDLAHRVRLQVRESLPGRESLREEDRNVVRVMPLQIRWGNTEENPFSDLLPTSSDSMFDQVDQMLYSAYTLGSPKYSGHTREEKKASAIFDDLLAPGKCDLTQVPCILKNERSVNPNQIMFPGGKIGPGENEENAGIRELDEEIHIYGINPSMLSLLGQRKYSFINDKDKNNTYRINNTETALYTKIPPFLKSQSFDPADKAIGVFELTPHAIKQLFDTGSLTNPQTGELMYLLDSLKDPGKRPDSTRTDGSEGEMRQKIEEAVFKHEAETRVRTIDRLFLSTLHQQKEEHLKCWERIKKRYVSQTSGLTGLNLEMLQRFDKDYQDFLLKFERSYQIADFDETPYITPSFAQFIQDAGIPVNARVKKRIRLVQELQKAYNQIILTETIPFIENAGPQKPFLFTQGLLRRGLELDSNEYEMVKRLYPEVAAVYDTALEVFGIDPQEDPNWYEKLQNQMQEHVASKVKNRDGTLNGSKNMDYEASRDLFFEFFADRLGIQVLQIDELADYANQFSSYLTSSLKPITHSDVIKRLFPNPRYTDTTSIEELMLVAFGYDQYTSRHDVPPEVQWTAWRKILLMQQFNTNNRIWAKHMHNYIYPIRSVFQMMAEYIPHGEHTIADGHSMEKYQLTIPITGLHEVKVGRVKSVPVDLSTFPVFLYANARDKEKVSFTRKCLERGVDVSDFFGTIYVIDSESFKLEVEKRFKVLGLSLLDSSELEKIADVWSQKVTEEIIRTFHQQLTDWHFEYETSKPRESKALTGTLEKSQVPVKEGLIYGSGASNIQWSQFKLVQTIRRDEKDMQEEIQILPSLKDAQKKFIDDPDFWLRRLFKSHKVGFYPLMLILFGIPKSYEDLMASYSVHTVHNKPYVLYDASQKATNPQA